MTHCKNCTPVLTHTKLGACICLWEQRSIDEEPVFVTFDLIPVYPINEIDQLKMFNTVIKTFAAIYRIPTWRTVKTLEDARALIRHDREHS